MPRLKWPAPARASATMFALSALTMLAARAAAQADAPTLKRGDELIVFRQTTVDLPDGSTRTFTPGTRGRVAEPQGPQVIVILRGAKLPIPVENIVSGRSGVARISAEIRERPDSWLNYMIRADLRRQLKDYEAALARSYAQAGDFANAVHWISEALDLATPADWLTMSEQLELLEAGEPIPWRRADRAALNRQASNNN